MTDRPEFPEVWDSTMVREVRECLQKFQLLHIRHLRAPEESIHLHFGGVFAAGICDMRRAFYSLKSPIGGDATAALAAGCQTIIKRWGQALPANEGAARAKTLEGCLDALYSFAQQYPLDREAVRPLMIDGEPVVEKTFAVPLPWVKHPVTGQPIVYSGRFDMLCHYLGNDAILIDDEKTTTALGDSWSKQWRLRSQLTGYFWALEQYGYKVAGIIIRGVGVLRTQITHAFVLEQRSAYNVEMWLEQTQRDIQRAINAWGEGYWDYNLDSACSAFGGCQFLDACASNNPEQWLSRFVARKWDPLARDEVGANPAVVNKKLRGQT